MLVLLLTLFMFFLAFIIHVVIWRANPRKRQVGLLAIIFLTNFLVTLLVLFVIAIFEKQTFLNIFEFFHIGIFYFSLTFAYFLTYSAIAADSPSLVIIEKIADVKTNGIFAEDLEKALNDDFLIKPRLQDLLDEKMAYLSGDKYRLAKKGKILVSVFIFYRRLINIERLGG